MARTSNKLPPLNKEALESAVKAYRMALEYCLHVEGKWAPRQKELSALDPFHRTRVAYENATFLSERLAREALFVVEAVLNGVAPFPLAKFNRDLFQRSKDRGFLRALHAFKEAFQIAGGVPWE